MIRKTKKKIDFKYRIIGIMFLIVISIFLLFISFSYDISFRFINSIFYYPFSNLTNSTDIIGMNINSELEKELSSLKDDLSIPFVLSDYSLINGVVISRNPSYWLDEIIVNKGIDSGIEEGMCVVIGEGVVGYVKDVYSNYSVVVLITNNSFNNTSVRINDSYLILEYDKNGNMIVRQLDNNLSINEGDVVFTSGLTNKYPSGITIGYVSRIENNSYDTGKILYISLYYDINDIKYVSFLKRMI